MGPSGFWKRRVAPGETRVVGPYPADSESQLDGLLGALPLYQWMHGGKRDLRNLSRRMSWAGRRTTPTWLGTA